MLIILSWCLCLQIICLRTTFTNHLSKDPINKSDDSEVSKPKEATLFFEVEIILHSGMEI